MQDIFNLDKKAKLLQKNKDQNRVLNLDDTESATESYRLAYRPVNKLVNKPANKPVNKQVNKPINRRVINLDEDTVDDTTIDETIDDTLFSNDDTIISSESSDSESDGELSEVGNETGNLSYKTKTINKKSTRELTQEEQIKAKEKEAKKKAKQEETEKRERKKEMYTRRINVDKDSILESLKGYYKIEKEKWELIPLNAHIRYIDKKNIFYIGGYKKTNGNGYSKNPNKNVRKIMICNKRTMDSNKDTNVCYYIDLDEIAVIFAKYDPTNI